MPRRRKLHILRFAFRGKSSVVPLCPEEIPLGDSSSPHQTHFVGLWRGPFLHCFRRTHAYCTYYGEFVTLIE